MPLHELVPILHFCVVHGKTAAARLLLEKGTPVDAPNNPNHEVSPLQGAVIEENTDMAELLLNYSANVERMCNFGLNALHMAVMSQNEKMIKLLVDRGANVHSRCKKGRNSLYIAIDRHSSLDIVRFLLAKGAVIYSKKVRRRLKDYDIEFVRNHPEMFYFTPNESSLHAAVKFERRDIIREILKHGTKFINEKDMYDFTALDHTILREDLEVAEILLEHGADINFSVSNAVTAPILVKYRVLRGEKIPKQFSSLEATCRAEIELLKKCIGQSLVTPYKVLTYRLDKSIGLVRNGEVRLFLESCHYPIYGNLVRQKYQLAKERCDLMVECDGECPEQVLEYLSNTDLNNVIKAMKRK